ncbi:hypothetical protein BHM03_00013283 [Ensete ventricosum]|nr:hypothetical protein BHM03_00013283 [Ensete ventricosum]
MKELEQRAAVALEEETAASQVSGLVADSSPGWSDQDVFQLKSSYVVEDDVIFTAHTKEVEVREEAVDVPGASTRRPFNASQSTCFGSRTRWKFHPTEEELLDFYLRRKVQGKRLQLEIIATVNLYRHDPWELPGIATVRADFCSDRKSSRG